MGSWERDPEGSTLALLVRTIPALGELVERCTAELATSPEMLFELGELDAREMAVLACAYNNLMALYSRPAPGADGPQPHLVDARRFLRESEVAPVPADLSCGPCAAAKLVAATRGTFILSPNGYTLTEDSRRAYVPHDPSLRDIMRVFEAWIFYRQTLRLAEVVALGGRDDPEGSVFIVDRLFANTDEYVRYAGAHERRLGARQRACRRALDCPRCLPCIATAVLAMLPARDDATISRRVETVEQPMAPWYDPMCAIVTHYTRGQPLAMQQNAVLWFLGGVPNPLGTFFRAAASLDNGTADPGVAVALVQETIVRSFKVLSPYEERRKQCQIDFVAPTLRRGLLPDATDRSIVTSTRLRSTADRRHLKADLFCAAGPAARDRNVADAAPHPGEQAPRQPRRKRVQAHLGRRERAHLPVLERHAQPARRVRLDAANRALDAEMDRRPHHGLGAARPEHVCPVGGARAQPRAAVEGELFEPRDDDGHADDRGRQRRERAHAAVEDPRQHKVERREEDGERHAARPRLPAEAAERAAVDDVRRPYRRVRRDDKEDGLDDKVVGGGREHLAHGEGRIVGHRGVAFGE